MPLRSVKMKRFIFGFQRRVWCPKCTPLSRSWRMVTTAMLVVLVARLSVVGRSTATPGDRDALNRAEWCWACPDRVCAPAVRWDVHRGAGLRTREFDRSRPVVGPVYASVGGAGDGSVGGWAAW